MIITMTVACNSGTGSTENKSEAEQTETAGDSKTASSDKIKLEFWDMVWGPAEYISEGEALTKKFNEEHDNIEVTYQSLPWDNFYQTFTTAIASNSAPDVSTGSGYQQHQFAIMDEILPLDSIIEEWKSEGKLNDFIEGAIEQFKWEGKQIGIPWNCDPRAVFYRKDIFEANNIDVPTTWEEFEQAAIKLTKDDMYGFVSAASDSSGYWAMAFFIFGHGGRIFNENKEPDFGCPENIEALERIQRLVKAGVFPPGIASYTAENAQKLFLQGKATMIYMGADFGSILQGQNDEKLVENVDILPVFPASNGKYYSPGGMNAIMAYKQSEHPEECKTFIKWWSENNNSLWTDGHTGAFSVRKSTLGIDYFQKDKYKKLLSEKIMPSFITTNSPIPNAFPEMAGVEGELVLRDAYQLILNSSYSVEDVVEHINAKLSSILQSDN